MAVSEGDSVALLEHVDMEAVEANLKPFFEQRLAQDIQSQNPDSDLLILGEAMGPLMVDRMVWEYSHREAIVHTMLSGEPTKHSDIRGQPNQVASLATQYGGLNRFEISTQTSDPVTLVLKRRGLGWKIAAIEFTP